HGAGGPARRRTAGRRREGSAADHRRWSDVPRQSRHGRLNGGSRVARVSIIGPTSIVIGDVTGRGDLEIIGRVQGDVVLEGTVTVAPDGVVLGSIRAQGVRVAGRVDGSVVAKESLSLQAGANVSGDLVAARLGIEEGARVRGTVRTEGGDLEEDDDEDEVIADQSDDVDATPSEAPGGHERR